MTIELHIERLILDGLELGPNQAAHVGAAVESELARLLTEGGIAAQLRQGSSVPHLQGGAIRVAAGDAPAQIGQRIARSVYTGLGVSARPRPPERTRR